MGKRKVDRIPMSFNVDRELAEAMDGISNKSEFLNRLIRENLCRIGDYTLTEQNVAIRVELKKRAKKEVIRMYEEVVKEMEEEWLVAEQKVKGAK